MSHRLKAPLALLALTLLCLATATAVGAQVDTTTPPAPGPAVVHPLIEQLFAYLGMAAAALSTLAAILPKTWKLTQLCARFSVDLRGILTPDTADDPSWANRAKRDSNVLMVLAVAAALGCGAAQRPSVLDGAQTALNSLCEHLPSPHLDMARQLLEARDIKGAVDYLRRELDQNGHQKDVAALLALLESQLPDAK